MIRRAADQLDLELAGELNEAALIACETDVRAQLSVAKAGSVKITIDLLAVQSYSLQARDALVALQRFIGSRASQTALIANTASSRALALWVAHVAEGQLIKTFGSRDDAALWLASRLSPATGVRPLARPRRATPTPLLNGKKAAS